MIDNDNLEIRFKMQTLYDDKMIIFYNTPKTIDLDESQGFSFYDRNVKMPYVIQNKKDYGMQDFRLVMKIE